MNNDLIINLVFSIINRNSYLWKEKVIKYYVHSKLNEDVINYALLRISKETCFIFKQTKNPRKALFLYQPGPFYETNLGKRREIPHRIFVPKGKEENLACIRYNYITINGYSIKRGFSKYFKKNLNRSANTYNIGYDYRSVMHFSENEYGIFGRRVITAKNKLMQNLMGKTQDLTFYDAKLVNKRYCRFPSQIHPPCHNYGYSHPKSPNCKCPPFADGIDCTGWIINNRYCTAVNHFYAKYISNTVLLRSFYNTRHRRRICKESRSVEIRYLSDLAASGILFCPGDKPISIRSEEHLVIIQSHFPPEQLKLKINYWRVPERKE
uniref:Metalloendopeptidase n=1 Tax=Strongyloides papillosus TaxID=174720 RepID=A0A0N5B207_STREA